MARLIVCGAVVAALTAVAAPAAASDVTYDKLAYLSFSAPVQIPGVTLNAGTYRFRLANPDTSRNVLQVLSNDGAIVYAMFHTIPDSRATTTEEAIVSFRETPRGVAPAVRSLFYGGEYRGYEFVYPRGGPNMIAEIAPQPEISYSPLPVVAVPEPAEEVAPAPEPVAEPMPEPVAEPSAEPEETPAPAELPRTASPLPFLAAGGMASLLAGLGFGLLRRQVG